MNWTKEQKDLAQKLVTRMGARTSVQALSFFLKRHLNINPTAAAVQALLDELRPAAPQAALKKLTLPTRRRKVKETCAEIINELKEEIAEHGVREIQSELTEEGVTPILVLSDLHFGEVIESNGRILFDIDIATRAFESIIDQAIEARELMAYDVDEFVVLLAGDIIDGELIFPAQAFETDGDVFSQMKIAHSIIWRGLTRLADAFGNVKVYCVPGNHGRSSKLHSQMSNWDNALYFGLQLVSSMQQDYNIAVYTPHQLWMDFKVRNWNVHTRHIGVTQATTAGPGRRVQNWMNQHNADLFFFGHYHNPEMFSHGYKRIFKNGSLPPANEFAERLGFLDSRGQWLIGVTDFDAVSFSKILIPDGLDN